MYVIMFRARRDASSIINFLIRNSRNRKNLSSLMRNLSAESNQGHLKLGDPKLIRNDGLQSNSVPKSYTDVVKQICKIMRIRPRWEQTLLSDFPSIDFSDPLFFRELLREQSNALLSLRFLHWLRSNHDFTPDTDSCNALFDALVEARACETAQSFLDDTTFTPKPGSLERYIICLSEEGIVEEAIAVFAKLKGIGICPSIMTWNSTLLGCLQGGRTDLFWSLYQELLEWGSIINVDDNTVGCLIQAFCCDGKVSKAHQLLRQVLKDGFRPGNVTYNKLIAASFKEKDFTRISEILHTMIASNRTPDMLTYQEVISGLCQNGMYDEGYRVFNDLVVRGYSPDRIMYTNMIYGLCCVGLIDDARKLLFEMIDKGLLPNEFTYNALLYGYCKLGEFKAAKELFNEMRDRGYKETTLSYNIMINGLCSCKRSSKAHDLFKEMTQKGIAPDVITYNTLIRGFTMEGNIGMSKDLWEQRTLHNLVKEMSKKGIAPDTIKSTLIRELSAEGKTGKIENQLKQLPALGILSSASSATSHISKLCKIMSKGKLQQTKAVE